MAEMTTKQCSKCGRIKHTDEFAQSKSRRDGLSCWCKGCNRLVAADYRVRNPEKARAYGAAWYVANLEKVRAYGAARYRASPEKISADSAAWKKANPEKARASRGAWNKANPEKARASANIGNKRRSEYLTDSYVASLLQIPTIDAPAELLELKREQLTIHRLKRELKQAIKSTKETA